MLVCTRQAPDGWQPWDAPLPLRAQQLLAARGVIEPEVLNFANLPDWSSLKGIDTAVALLLDILVQQKRLLVVGDYDADGATATALAVSMLRALGVSQVDFMVPNRFRHGYGLTPALLDEIGDLKPDLVITVDHGISSVEGVAYAAKKSIPVLITDHHLSGKVLPDAAAIVNPNQSGCPFPCKNLAGVGVLFYVLIALRATLRAQGWFQDRPEPNLAEGLDLVALGTIADVVSLDYSNRCLVQQGLLRMRSGGARPGIVALAESAKVDLVNISSRDLAFRMAPRLNAAGRMEDMHIGICCLLATDASEAAALAKQLNEHNSKRRKKGGLMQAQAKQVLQLVVNQQREIPAGICLSHKTWHPGLIGILAGRLRDKWHRPALVLAPAGDDSALWRGSARSIADVHIKDAFMMLDEKHPGLMQGFGGHAMAAGLSVDQSQVEDLRKAFMATMENLVTPAMLRPEITTDGSLHSSEMSIELATLLEQISPWGKDFPEPSFHGDFKLGQNFWLGESILKMRVQPVEATQGIWLQAIDFNASKDDWPANVKRVRLVYELGVNRYKGEQSLQLVVRACEVIA